ncbi:hypothetical protein [Streptomyces beihaiensis]|uniref:Uncharacterized protein n=1 Tax=Streptomyces beihaiensis TaxID=2984495 RepID=A0ABT3U697_9ACTN|nr:hypothetical protein [Streptomyces beihaiensis]MCX3064186.1 hypothetical protein [Streptomyces beihaiensis]
MSAEGGRYCGRCDEPIRPGEASRRFDVFSPSGPGAIIEQHRVCPVPPPPRQTAPVGLRRR